MTKMDGQLYLDGTLVGDVAISGWHGSWGFGDFTPRPGYARFAPIFDEWSRLMHADKGRLSREHAGKLREVECRMYELHAKLWIVQERRWRQIAILTIDGGLIEWKERWPASAGSKEPPPPLQEQYGPIPPPSAREQPS
jgi:hypothetical protein